MNKTGIGYLDYSWNPLTGCSPVSAGCQNCWAKKRATENAATGSKWYDPKDPFKPTLHRDRLDEPSHRKTPSVIGVGFMGDICHPDLPEDALACVLQSCRIANQHTYLWLTKRADRLGEALLGVDPVPNVWLGVSVENMAGAIERLPILAQLAERGWHTWVSMEPLIGSVTLAPSPHHNWDLVEWVIVGCESGDDRRPMDPAWVTQLHGECDHFGIPFFLKQMEVGGKVQAHPTPYLNGVQHTEIPDAIQKHLGTS